jgi:parallel beta-helix repeat protein
MLEVPRKSSTRFVRPRFLVARLLIGVFLLCFNLVACSTGPPPPSLEASAILTFTIYRDGATATYHADSLTTSSSYTGTLKFVVQNAVAELSAVDGGKISFQAGDFDLGADWFDLRFITDITFEGQGIDVTVIHNDSSAATDTEPFNCTGCDRLNIRDMTVSAGGPFRSTSDALDFDGGDNLLIERVKVTGARGRGIVFDGKGGSGISTADRNVVRDCIVTGVPSHGIELLASNFNLIENCTISDVAGSGIVVNKSSTSATQPNKQSNDNVIIGNHVDNSGSDGIRVNSSSRNIIRSNTVLNSSDDVSSRDGILIFSSNSVACNNNVVDFNTATDNQAVKTQRYGLRINNATCNGTLVGTNDFSGNLTGAISNSGTGTIFNSSSDTEAPTEPTDLTAVGGVERVDLSWTAATDNIAVIGYEIYRDGSMLASVGTVTTYMDTVVDGGVTYNYQVRARDASANWSVLSASAAATTSSATTFTFAPVADTYVYASSPTSNYGSSSTFAVDGNPVKHILLKFSVFGVGANPVSSATLRLYTTNSSPVGGSFYLVSDTSWSESSVTWNTAPAADPTPFTSLGAVNSGSWYDVDFSSIITGDGLISVKVVSANSDSAYYSAKEGSASFRPQLIVETAGGP